MRTTMFALALAVGACSKAPPDSGRAPGSVSENGGAAGAPSPASDGANAAGGTGSPSETGGAPSGTISEGGCQSCLLTLATGQFVLALVSDAANVYWTENSGVMREAHSGGAPERIASGGVTPHDIALDRTSVYWTDPGARTVMRAPLAGGAAQTLASGSQYYPQGIAVDGRAVYFGTGSDVMRVPLTGGASDTLATGQSASSIAVDGANVYWTNWSADLVGAVMRAPLSGGIPQTIASGQTVPHAITVDAHNVYWANDGNLMRVPMAGGSPEALVSNQTSINGIAVDGTNVYWTNWAPNGAPAGQLGKGTSDGTVMKVSASGGKPQVVAASQSGRAIAVDATSVYWANYVDETVMKLTPK